MSFRTTLALCSLFTWILACAGAVDVQPAPVAEAWDGASDESAPLDLPPSEVDARSSSIDSACTGGLTLSGRIIDAHTAPYPDVLVRTNHRDPLMGQKIEVLTDAQGNYCVTHLEEAIKVAHAIANCEYTFQSTGSVAGCGRIKLLLLAKLGKVKFYVPGTNRRDRKYKIEIPVATLMNPVTGQPLAPSEMPPLTGYDWIANGRSPLNPPLVPNPSFLQIETLAGSMMDIGMNGLGHGIALPPQSKLAVNLSCSGKYCNINGVVDNATAFGGDTNLRCTNNTAIKCTTDAACGSGFCRFHLPPIPADVGGTYVCMTASIDDGTELKGQLDREGGDAFTGTFHVSVKSRMISDSGTTGIICPQCTNRGGGIWKCNAGANNNGICTVGGVGAFGAMSLDCPPTLGTEQHFDHMKVLPMSTRYINEASLVLSAESPGHTFPYVGLKNPTGACNNATSRGCRTATDCPEGGICRGVTNLGAGSCDSIALNPYSGIRTSGGSNRCSGNPALTCAPPDPEDPFSFDLCVAFGAGACSADPVPNTCFYGVDPTSSGVVGGAATPGQVIRTRSSFQFLPGDTGVAELGQVLAVPASSAASVNMAAGLPGPARLQLKVTGTLR